MRLEYSYHQRGQFRPHFNLYAINPENGTYVLMTKDHIIPVSKGGTDSRVQGRHRQRGQSANDVLTLQRKEGGQTSCQQSR